jgi:hypothetical protein
MNDDDVGALVRRLEGLALEELRSRWRLQFGRSAPKGLPRRILFRLLAYRLQAEKYGDLDPEAVHFLDSVERDKDAPLPTLGQATCGGLMAGTVLVREHGGIRHHVTITKEGFSWNGLDFKSLSKVAKAITGTAWNGPRFFGLRDARNG